MKNDHHLERHDPATAQLNTIALRYFSRPRDPKESGARRNPEASVGATINGEGGEAELPGPRLVSSCLRPGLPFIVQEMQSSSRHTPKSEGPTSNPMTKLPRAGNSSGSRAMPHLLRAAQQSPSHLRVPLKPPPEQSTREGLQGRPPVTWCHRPRCPLHPSCPPPPSSGHPCSVSALFSSSRT